MSELIHTALHAEGTVTPALPYSRPITPGVLPQMGFIGLGAMGYFMARNLVSNQTAHPTGAKPLLVWNRSVAKSEKLLKELGAQNIRIAQSPAELAAECDIVITNLASDEVVKEIYGQITKALQHTQHEKNRIFVETSTIYPTVAGELDKMISSVAHAHLITSPVFGPPPAADKAELIIVMSGDYRSKKEVAYLFVPAIGKKVIDLGGNLEKAPTFKLIGNSMIMGCLEILAESFTLAEKSGIGAKTVQSLVKDMLPSTPFVNYGEKMANDQFDGSTGFAIDGGIKDASHIRRLTTEVNSPMPMIDAAHQHLLTARALHNGQKLQGKQKYETLDWSGMIAGARVAAGLDAFDSSQHTSLVLED